jgi:hypothetical protein
MKLIGHEEVSVTNAIGELWRQCNEGLLFIEKQQRLEIASVRD